MHNTQFGVWEPFFHLPHVPVTPNLFLPLSPSQALKTDSKVDTLTPLLWKLPPAQKIKGLDSVHVYLKSHTFNSKYHRDNVLLSFTSKFTQQLVCGFWHPPKAALPEGHNRWRQRDELASILCVWLGGEGDGYDLQVGQGRTASLCQFKETKEKRAGLTFHTCASLGSPGPGTANEGTLLILLQPAQ